MTTGPKPKPPIERFRRFISKKKNGCWLWTGNTNGAYGLFRIGSQRDNSRKIVLAHRWHYQYVHGPIPDGLFVCHTCDVKICVNPSHMFLGTNSENIRDAIRKGVTIGAPNKGEANGRAVLNKDDVLSIRAAYPTKSLRALADTYGVSATQISWIVTRKSWKHV